MNQKIGFIGGGNMGRAIIAGLLSSKLVEAQSIIASDINPAILGKLKTEFGIRTTENSLEAAAQSDILFLSVKPAVYPAVITAIKDHIKTDTIFVAIAAGQSIRTIEELFEREIKLVRVMPNTPALVGEGMAALSVNHLVTESDTSAVLGIFNSIGKAEVVAESLMDAVTGVSGSGPAYVYLFIEAMADAAVAEGMPRQQAYRFAAQTVLGAAKMVLETDEHPAVLKDQVCSAGGTTIAAVCELEKQGMRSAVISAVKACAEKSRALGKT